MSCLLREAYSPASNPELGVQDITDMIGNSLSDLVQ